MTWEAAVYAFAGLAFVWIWHQLHREIVELRKWRHGLEGAMPSMAAGLTAVTDRMDGLDRELEKLRQWRHSDIGKRLGAIEVQIAELNVLVTQAVNR